MVAKVSKHPRRIEATQSRLRTTIWEFVRKNSGIPDSRCASLAITDPAQILPPIFCLPLFAFRELGRQKIGGKKRRTIKLRYESSISKSSVDRSSSTLLFSCRMASASPFFLVCSSAIFSSTVPRQIKRYAKTCCV